MFSMFYLPRKRFRLVWFRMSPRFPSCLAQIHILNAIETEGDEHIIAKNTQHTIIVSDCVGLCRVPTTHRTYKNAIGHKSSAELLLNICVNVLFTRKNDDLLRKFSVGFFLSLYLSNTPF